LYGSGCFQSLCSHFRLPKGSSPWYGQREPVDFRGRGLEFCPTKSLAGSADPGESAKPEHRNDYTQKGHAFTISLYIQLSRAIMKARETNYRGWHFEIESADPDESSTPT